MTTILFTDTHFGIKQNSITWFNSQKDFIVNQLIPYIKVKNLNGKTKEEVINSMSDKQKQDKVSVLKTRALAQLVKHYSRIK